MGLATVGLAAEDAGTRRWRGMRASRGCVECSFDDMTTLPKCRVNAINPYLRSSVL